MTLIPITIPTRSNGPVTITGERVTDNFAMTPSVSTTEDGATRLGDRLNLTHTGTGRVVSWSMWLNLRDLAHQLEALPIDWAALTENNLRVEHRKLVHDTIRAAEKAYGARDHDEFPEWAGDPATPALSLLRTALDDAIRMSGMKVFEGAEDLAAKVKALDADLGKQTFLELAWRGSAATVAEYGVAYLLAVLHRVNPEAADKAAERLAAAWECGDSLGEWVWQWRDELGRDEPLTLHGFADIGFPTEASQ